MGIYSTDTILDDYIGRLYEQLLSERWRPVPESFKEIAYGISFRAESPNGRACPISVYHTDKKGFSIVTSDDRLRRIASLLLSAGPLAGNDEAGKGDIFGPLCVASFFLAPGSEKVLEFPIRDSKEMTDEAVLSISAKILHDYASFCEIVKIYPRRYNEFYADLKSRGKSLNHLLAWAHGTALKALSSRHETLEKALIDQFSNASDIVSSIRAAAPRVAVEFRTKAESERAVAVASVLARGEYLRALKKLSEEALEGEILLKSGSGPASDRLIAQIRERFGEEKLSEVAKIHFSNISGRSAE